MSTLILSGAYLVTNYTTTGIICSANAMAPSTISMLAASAQYNASSNYGPNILLEIYKGTKPTDFTGFTNVSSQVSNLLISFQCGSVANNGSGADDLSTQNYYKYRVGKSQAVSSIATATGTATWFILRRATLTPAAPAAGGVGDLTSLGAIMGTVGVTGSGADMEIDTTSIVNGNPYRSNGFIIGFPIVPLTV